MDIKRLIEKKQELINLRKKILIKENPKEILDQHFDHYESEFLSSKAETKEEIRIKNGLSNLKYMKKSLLKGDFVTENMVKDVHQILMEGLFVGGIYRNTDVRISNTDFIPPSYYKAYEEIKYFYHCLEKKQKDKNKNTIHLASFAYVELLSIHPFIDGNGRTARSIMNYSLIQNDFPSIVFDKEERNECIDRIEECRKNKSKFMKEHIAYTPIESFICKKSEENIEKLYKKLTRF